MTFKLFKLHFPDLYRAMEECEHNSPYHQEGSVLTHTKMVYNHAMQNYPENKIVQLAALLHDIGKPSAMRVDPRDNKTRFNGHEGYSTFLAREILEYFNLSREEKIQILNLISLHGVNIEQLQYPNLEAMRECDMKGRISSKELREYPRRQFLILPKNPTHTVTIMIGLPGAGKSTLAESLNLPIISRDDIITNMFPDKTYNEAYNFMQNDKLAHMGVGAKFEMTIRTAAKEQKDIVIDMTMLSLSSRRSMMTKFPNAKFKAIVVMPPLPIVKERASKRPGKEMSDKVYEHMLPTFTMPVKEEGFEEITYILE